MACENKKAACGECIIRLFLLLTSGAAIAMALYILIIIPRTADVSFSDFSHVFNLSATIDPDKRILVLNIITVVVGSIMWIVIFLSLILKWKQGMLFAVISIMFIITESLGFGATGVFASQSAAELLKIVKALSDVNTLFANRTYLVTSGKAAAATAGISLLTSVTSGILALTELVLLIKKKVKGRKQKEKVQLY